MARRAQVTIIDDINGTKGASTVKFGLDGVQYEIDLSAENEADLRATLEDYVGHGRRIGGRRVRRDDQHASSAPSPSDPGEGREYRNAIREWAREQGIAVGDRGQLQASLVVAYEKRDTSPENSSTNGAANQKVLPPARNRRTPIRPAGTAVKPSGRRLASVAKGS